MKSNGWWQTLLGAGIGSLLAGGFALYISHQNIEVLKSQHLDNRDLELKQNQRALLAGPIAEVLREYGDVTNVGHIARHSIYKGDHWYKLEAYSALMTALGEPSAARAISHFMSSVPADSLPRILDQEPQGPRSRLHRDSYHAARKKMVAVFDSTLRHPNIKD